MPRESGAPPAADDLDDSAVAGVVRGAAGDWATAIHDHWGGAGAADR